MQIQDNHIEMNINKQNNQIVSIEIEDNSEDEWLSRMLTKPTFDDDTLHDDQSKDQNMNKNDNQSKENDVSQDVQIISNENTQEIISLIDEITSAEQLKKKYGSDKPFTFAVGDGNHSIATAKLCWDSLKKTLSPEQRVSHPARYFLCELVNLYD